MITKTKLVSLAAIAGLLITGTVVTLYKQPTQMQVSQERVRYFPNLINELNKITKISIATSSSQFDIIKQNNNWIIPQRANYQADTQKIKSVLFGLAELIILESKTSNPKYFNKIQLQSVSQSDSLATEIRLQDKNGKEVMAILIGKERQAKANADLTEFFIRSPNDNKSWLTAGILPVYREAAEWFNDKIIQIDESAIKKVTLSAQNAKPIIIKKTSPTQSDFTLVDIPKDKKLDSPFALKYIASTLGDLSLEDVAEESSIIFDKKSTRQATLETFDGMLIHYLTTVHKNKTYVKLEAMLRPNLTKQQEEKIRKQISELNKNFSRWVYVIPDYQAEEINKQAEDLLAS